MLDRSSPKKYLSLHHHTHPLGLDGLAYFQSYNVFKDIYLPLWSPKSLPATEHKLGTSE